MDYIQYKYMYLKWNKTRNLIKSFFIINIILIIVYIFNPYVALNLSTVIETVLIFAITFISTSILKFSNRYRFKIISFCLLTIALLKFSTLVYLLASCSETKILESIQLQGVSIALILESIYCFIIVAYNKRPRKLNVVIIGFMGLIAFISSFLSNIYIFFGITTILFTIILFQFRDFKLIIDKSINYLKLLVILNILVIFLDLITFHFEIRGLLLISDIIKIFVYIIIYIGVADVVIRKPYDNLNKKIIEKNSKIRRLNKRMESSNNAFKRFNKRIKGKENYFKDFIENVPKPMIVLNINNLRIFTFNKEFTKEFKIKNKRELINKNIFDLIKVENKDMFILSKRGVGYAVCKGEEKFWNLEIIADTKENLIISLENISELKHAEKIKGNLNKKGLEEQIKKDFLASISHDLKTPINVIYTSTQLQKKILESNSLERIDYYNQVNKENCITLMRLANNLIDSSKIDYDYLKPNLKVYNIVDLVEDSIDKLSEYIKDKELAYIFDTNEEEVFVKCDQEFMQRIVINLISNSIKHTRHGGICVNIKASKKKVFIDFSDTGEGMEKDFLNRACDKYYKVENSLGLKNKSTGIGLYIVKNLVELQNGTIKIDSIKYVGTNIRLEFSRENTCEI